MSLHPNQPNRMHTDVWGWSSINVTVAFLPRRNPDSRDPTVWPLDIKYRLRFGPPKTKFSGRNYPSFWVCFPSSCSGQLTPLVTWRRWEGMQWNRLIACRSMNNWCAKVKTWKIGRFSDESDEKYNDIAREKYRTLEEYELCTKKEGVFSSCQQDIRVQY